SVFLCPSDKNAAEGFTNVNGAALYSNNCYFGSVGTTTNLTNESTTNFPITSAMSGLPTTGLFGFQRVCGLRDILDGTSNTIAFCESTVGATKSQAGQLNIGLVNIGGVNTGQVADAWQNPAVVLAALKTCDDAWTARTGTIDRQRGLTWLHGAMAFTLFN